MNISLTLAQAEALLEVAVADAYPSRTLEQAIVKLDVAVASRGASPKERRAWAAAADAARGKQKEEGER